jgi:Uma2 family endonuclease
MNAQLRPVDIEPQVVPMTVEALRLLDVNGFFDADCNKYELIDGVLVMTPPPGTGHFHVEGRAQRSLTKALLSAGLYDTYQVQSGASFEIDNLTVLGPDLVVIPIPQSPSKIIAKAVVALIEIAYSSRANDLGQKALLYASAGIEDYWVLDVAAKSVIVHRDPIEGVYTSVQSFNVPQNITSLKVPDISVAVADLF